MGDTSEKFLVQLSDGPIHGYFGLSYCTHLVLSRTVLQSMPLEWQAMFVSLLRELNGQVEQAKLDLPYRYRVQAVDDQGRFVEEGVPHYRHAPNVLGLDNMVELTADEYENLMQEP